MLRLLPRRNVALSSIFEKEYWACLLTRPPLTGKLRVQRKCMQLPDLKDIQKGFHQNKCRLLSASHPPWVFWRVSLGNPTILHRKICMVNKFSSVHILRWEVTNQEVCRESIETSTWKFEFIWNVKWDLMRSERNTKSDAMKNALLSSLPA